MAADAPASGALVVTNSSSRSPLLPPATPPFPQSLKLEQFRVLLVGGGPLGLEKLAAILRNSPATAVTVVAPQLLPELAALAEQHARVQLHKRPFQDQDLNGQDFVFAATDDPALNRYIQETATARRILTNAEAPTSAGSTPPENTLPRAGNPLYVALTTSARVAKRLRAVLGEPRPYELHTVLQQMKGVRERLQAGMVRNIRVLNSASPQLPYGPVRESADTAFWERVVTGALALFAVALLLTVVAEYISWPQAWAFLTSSRTFYLFVAVGFVAQLVDGLLGMGYGVVSAISLMSLGLSPAAVSASIHTAEIFASGASGYQHYRFGNVNKRLFWVLLLPGVAGSVAGALLLSLYGAQHAGWIRPLLAVYLLVLGVRILSKALRKERKRRRVKNAGWLAGAGGFLDSFGGGGWGPLVTSTLIASGRTPQYVIGTVSLVEFFVTFASAITFFSLIGISHWQIVAGLIVGGVAAAPLAARLAGRVPTRWMFLGVGLLVIGWSLWSLRKLF